MLPHFLTRFIVILALCSFSYAATAPDLGTANSFAVLAGTTVTNTGTTIVGGDLGVSPGTAITGFPPGTVSGTIYSAGAVASQAQIDVTTAYNNLAAQSCDVVLTGQNLGGLMLVPGTYCFDSTAQLTGMLTLDAQNDVNAVFIFKIGTALTTASGSSVVIINQGSACNVFWQVGSSATLGTTTSFVGNIVAFTSITLTTGALVTGRALARNGAVTLDSNVVTNVCTPFSSSSSSSSSGASVLSSSSSSGAAAPSSSAPMLSSSSSSAAAASSSSARVVGDPSFVGLRGQSYQVHGMDGQIYNLISSANTQINSRFVFLTEGKCPMLNDIPDTNCWSHPGSYLGEIGVQQRVGDHVHQLLIVSGPAQKGFLSITLNDKSMLVNDSFIDTDTFSVSYVSAHKVTCSTEEFEFTFDNSDFFINQAVDIRKPMEQLTAHGLFGQTHKLAIYHTSVKYIEGSVDDYIIDDSNM